MGEMAIGLATSDPGWKIRGRRHDHGLSRCTVEHSGLVVSGTTAAAFDGNVIELQAGDLFHIPPEPHDSWVVGSEPHVSIHFLGADSHTR